jgi:hypothetical protein
VSFLREICRNVTIVSLRACQIQLHALTDAAKFRALTMYP